MTKYFIPGHHCCCGQPSCDFDYATVDVQWEDYGSDGTEGGAGFGTAGLILAATDTGSFTVRMAQEGMETLSVEAELFDDGTQTESGVTIRRADSSNNFSLVRVWGTTDAYELRQGSTVLEAFTATTAPGVTPYVKLVLLTPLAGTTDVECYVSGVLVHTEVGVTFSIPDVLNVGVIAKDGGGFGRITISPCTYYSGCEPTVDCSDVTLPHFWSLSVVVSGTQDIYGEECNQFLSGDWILMADAFIRWTGICNALAGEGEWCDKCFISGFNTASECTSTCHFETVFMERSGRVEDGWPEELVPDGFWASKQYRFNGAFNQGGDVHFTPHLVECFSGLSDPSTWYSTPPWSVDVEVDDVTDQVRLKAYGLTLYSTDCEGGGDPSDSAVYESAWFPITHNFTEGDVTLNLVDAGDSCTIPAAITLSPGAANSDQQKYLGGCEERCPAIDINPNYMVTGLMDPGFGASGEFCGFLEVSYNEDTFNYEWFGQAHFANEQECTLGDLFDSFTFEIKCLDIEEGALPSWWAIIHGRNGAPDEYIPVELDPVNTGTLSGATIDGVVNNICGNTAISMLVGECDPATMPFADCYCGDGLTCCITEGTAERNGQFEQWDVEFGQVEDENGVMQPTSGPVWMFRGPNPDPPPPGTAGAVSFATMCLGPGWAIWGRQVDAAGNVDDHYTNFGAGIQEDCAVLEIDFGFIFVRA